MGARRWNVPNALTLSRLPLAAAAAYLLWRKEDAGIGVGFLVAAALTDVFDGIAARGLGQITDFGKKLDPVVDKIAIGGVGLVLALKYGVPWWIFAVAVTRDAAIVMLGWLAVSRRRVVIPANFWGKAAASAMVFYGVAAVLSPGSGLATLLLWLVLATIIVSSASYGYDFYRVLSGGRQPPV